MLSSTSFIYISKLLLLQASIDCLYQPNDIVPIAVGVALAALVVAVLIAYMVGRRRNRHAGYQSV